MPLKEEMRKTGNYFFKHRSYMPLAVFVLFIPAFYGYSFFESKLLNNLYDFFCLFVSFSGLFIRIFTIGYVPKGTSGRNTSKQVADFLNTKAMYSIVRHPLYVGNFFMWLGIALFFKSFWLLLAVVLVFWLYYEKIMYAEEEFLREKYKENFTEWAGQTPLFIPDFKKWRAPENNFSFKNVLKREYPGFFAVILIFTALKITASLVADKTFYIDKYWLTLFAAGLLIYITLWTLKRKTKILHEDGR